MAYKEAVILYSGGTDSTCAASLIAQQFDRIHLLTYKRLGLFSVDNVKINVERLKRKFGEEKFIHSLFLIDTIFKEVSYNRYWHYFRKYGFFLLSTCGLCKLAMHVRTILYCRDNNIKFVFDGAHKGMEYSSDQMREVMDEFKKMYVCYGIEYNSPVYEFDSPDGIGWIDKLGLEVKTIFNDAERDTTTKKAGYTTGDRLFEIGLFPQRNVKGTFFDRQMQARCFQLVLFNVFVYWFFIPRYGADKYKKISQFFYQEKIKDAQFFLDTYIRKKEFNDKQE